VVDQWPLGGRRFVYNLMIDVHSPGVSGSGRLSEMTFRALSIGSALFSLTDVRLLGPNGSQIPFAVGEGLRVDVDAVPEPGSLVLLASGLMIAGIARVRGQRSRAL
jgi:hypothetical protein